MPVCSIGHGQRAYGCSVRDLIYYDLNTRLRCYYGAELSGLNGLTVIGYELSATAGYCASNLIPWQYKYLIIA